MLFRVSLLIAGAGLAVAGSISSQCSSTLLAVATSPQATCLDLTLLAPIILSNSSTTSIIPTVNSWLTGMCSQGLCSNATLQTVVTNITTGCSSDLASLGFTTDNSSSLVTTAQAAYPAVRQAACLKDTSTNTLCTTELLNGVQSATTTLTSSNIVGLFTMYLSGSTQNITLPQNVSCSDCTKAAYTVVSQDYPSLLTGEQAAIQSKCGSSFTNGQMPSTVQDTAVNSTSSSSGAAPLSVGSLSVGLASLVAISSVFAMFA